MCAWYVLLIPLAVCNVSACVRAFVCLPACVTGQSSTLVNALSYSGPYITGNTLSLCSGGSPNTSLTLLNNTGGVCVTFTGGYFGSSPDSTTTVTYGPVTNPTLFSCALVTGQSNNTRIYCDLQTSVGVNLLFQVHVQAGFNGLVQHSLAGTDTLHFPRPVIVAATIRTNALAAGIMCVA